MSETGNESERQNELRHAVYMLRRFVRRANCRELPDVIIDFKSHDDRARFIMEFESRLKPSESFYEGRRFGETEGVFIAPCGVSMRLTVHGR
jgi:hypothetical protein